MRTKRIKLYSYEELSMESKIKVINRIYKNNPDISHSEIEKLSLSVEYLKDGTVYIE